MMVQGLNDTESALRETALVMEQINPDQIHINQPIRPPAEPWVQPADNEGLLRVSAILGDKARVFTFPKGHFDLGQYENIVDAILAIITRHPMRQVELEQTLEEWGKGEVNLALRELADSGRAQIVKRYDTHFWSAAASHFFDDIQITQTNLTKSA